jgi:RNA polymerase sigma factor (sigma-70 family)
MAKGSLAATSRHLRSLLGALRAAAGDAHLLARYVGARDDGAFAELVRRHGPMVRGVCRRVLSNPHDAEDAFQATFLILARKAASIRGGDSLAGWLHRVALHAAVQLKRNISRRKDWSALPADVAQAERDDVSWREVRGLVDEELARLPERFRQPLILCYLEGKTRDEAAEELGWTLSTFRGRLERGRDRLPRRLERRGVTLSAPWLATLAGKADAATPNITASTRAATLAAEVIRAMFLSKMKTGALVCFAMLFLSIAAGGTAYRCAAVEPGASLEAAPAPRPSTPPAPPEEDGLVKDFKAHLDQFRLTIALRPKELEDFETRYPVSDLRLHVSPGPFAEPGGKGTAFARITEEQAAKIINVLAKDTFFRDSVADADRLTRPEGNHVEMWVSYRKGDTQPVRRWHTLEWNARLVRLLQAVRGCVDGEAAKALDKMLKSLEDQRKPAEKGELLKIDAVEDLETLWVASGDGTKEPLPRRVALDGVLPFAAWPKELTDEQKQVRADGLKLAKRWLEKQSVFFAPTRGPDRGDALRYAHGPTKADQEWKGQTPSELYAWGAFHVNVLLIQEGYCPFVRRSESRWDKLTLACYESAEQSAKLHRKGIWKDPDFAERVKKSAEKWASAEKADAGPITKWRSVRSTPPSKSLVPPVESLTFSPDGKQLLVSVNGRNGMQLLATDTLKELAITYPRNGACRPLGFTNDGTAWALSLAREEKDAERQLRWTYELLPLSTGKMFRSFQTPQLVRQVVLSPDLKYLAVTDYSDTSRVSLQDIGPGKEMTELGKHWSEVRCLAVSPDGKTLATGSAFTQKDAAEVILWDADRRSKVAFQELPANCSALQFTRDGSRLVALTKGKNREDGDAIVLWFNARNGKLLGRLEMKEQGDATALAASSNGKLLAVLSDHRVRIYDAGSGKEVAGPDGGDKVSGIAFSPDGTVLATGDENGIVTLWEAVR